MRFPQSVFITGNMPFAQSELSRCLTAMTGAELRPEGYPFTVTAGHGRGEGYRVSVTGRHTDIQGESPRAAVYGVYALLERLGAQFLAEDCEILPSVTEWKPISFSSRPDFAYRDLYWRGALNGRFALQCGLNSARAEISPEMGGKISFYRYSHTFEELVPPEKWFDAHPEYFSLVNGKRRREHSQLCLTNPDVLEICIEAGCGSIRTAGFFPWPRTTGTAIVSASAVRPWISGRKATPEPCWPSSTPWRTLSGRNSRKTAFTPLPICIPGKRPGISGPGRT